MFKNDGMDWRNVGWAVMGCFLDVLKRINKSSFLLYFNTMPLYILFESAIGYGLFCLKEFD